VLIFPLLPTPPAQYPNIMEDFASFPFALDGLNPLQPITISQNIVGQNAQDTTGLLQRGKTDSNSQALTPAFMPELWESTSNPSDAVSWLNTGLDGELVTRDHSIDMAKGPDGLAGVTLSVNPVAALVDTVVPPTSAFMAADTDTLVAAAISAAINDATTQLQAFVANQNFQTKLQQVFGNSWDMEAGQALIQDLL